MLQPFKHINKKTLSKLTELDSLIVMIKITVGIIISKTIAIFIGAEGLALIGNLRDFTTITHSSSILGAYKGVVKVISRFKTDMINLSRTISTAFYFCFVSTLLLCFICYYNASLINDLLFTPFYNYDYVIKIFAFVLPFYAVNMFCLAIMNGFSKYKNLLIINTIGQILGVLVSIVLIYQNHIDGALLAIVVAPSLIFLITCVGVINQKNFIKIIKLSNVNYKTLKRLSPYALITLVTAIFLPLISILIRSYIVEKVGLKEAGYWEAVSRVSKYNLMFIISLISVYILPKFRKIRDDQKVFKREILKYYKMLIPSLGIGLICIYFLRNFILKFIFSEEFLPAENLFFWQLLGDFMKVISLVIAYQFIAKKMFAHFIVIELFLGTILYFTSTYFIDIYGVEGAVIAHFVSYIMHYGIVILIFDSSIFGVISDKINDENEY